MEQITQTFARLISDTFTRYRGTIIEKRWNAQAGKNEFIVFRKPHATMIAAKLAVKKTYGFLQSSIERANNL